MSNGKFGGPTQEAYDALQARLDRLTAAAKQTVEVFLELDDDGYAQHPAHIVQMIRLGEALEDKS